MNHDDELRDAFERMSATPPVPTDRVESVHRRARRIRQRRAVLASAMSVAVVAAAVGIAIPLLKTQHSSRLTQAGPSSTDSGFGLGESPATSPAPRPSPSHKPKARPAGGVVHVVPSIGPSQPPVENVQFAVSAHEDPDSPAGYPLTVIELHVTGVVEGNISHVWMQYDDNMNRLDGHNYSYTCTHDDTFTVVDKTYTFKWHYRNSGSDHVFGGITTGICGQDTTPQHQFSDQITVPVGSTHSNGITEPTVTLRGSTPSGNHLALSATGYDLDGWIQTITVDWGDGSAPVVSSYPTCKDWDGTTWPYGYQTEDYTSAALAAGTYHVTVTVTTGGCDGKDVQTASDTWTATVS